MLNNTMYNIFTEDKPQLWLYPLFELLWKVTSLTRNRHIFGKQYFYCKMVLASPSTGKVAHGENTSHDRTYHNIFAHCHTLWYDCFYSQV